MKIYSKTGEEIGVQDKAGKNYFFTRKMNADPPKDFIVSDAVPKPRKRKAVINEPDDI